MNAARGAGLALAAVAMALAGCAARTPSASRVGNARHGAVLIMRAECGACHQIPGIVDADGLVGPPLVHFGRRTMIAGVLPNTPDALVRWLREPQAIVPGNGMPDMGLTEPQAHDIAAYLYTLR